MKRWISFWMIIVIASCTQKKEETTETPDQVIARNAYRAYLNKNLKDPSSLVIHSDSIYWDKHHISQFAVVDYGGRNSLGGITRSIERFKIFEGSVIGHEDQEDYYYNLRKELEELSNAKKDTGYQIFSPGLIK